MFLNIQTTENTKISPKKKNRKKKKEAQKQDSVNGQPALRDEYKDAEERKKEEKIENSKENGETPPGAKKRKRNRKQNKGVQKQESANGEPGKGGENKDAENKEKTHDPKENEDTTPTKKRKKNRKRNKGMPKPEPVNKEPATGYENKIIKEENTEENEDTPPGTKKRKKNRQRKKGTPKPEPVKEEPALRGENKSATEKNAEENEDTPTGTKRKRNRQHKKRIHELEPANEEPEVGGENTVATEENTEEKEDTSTVAKKKRKRKKKKGTQEQADIAEDEDVDSSPAKRIKTGSLNEDTGKTNKAQTVEMSLDPNKPLSKSQKKRLRKKKRKQSLEALHTTTTTTTTTGIMAKPGTEGATKARKRKLGDGEVCVTSDINSKESVDVPTKKTKKKVPGDSEDAKKRKLGEGDSSVASPINSKQKDVLAKKIKRESSDIDEESKKEPATLLDNDGQRKKKKQKRKKKQNHVGMNSVEVQEVDDAEAEESNPAKKLRTDNVENQDTKPEDGTLNKGRKKNKKKKKTQEWIETSTDTITNSIKSTAQTQPGVSTASIGSVEGKGTQPPTLHPSCTKKENMKRIAECWKGGSKKGLVLEEGSIEVIKNPFTCCYVPQLLQDEVFLEGVKKELDKVELLDKNNDLYKFRQTGDLRNITTPFIAGLRHLLYTDVRQWLMEVTGIPLNDTVDMGSSRYSHTDVLLCHDDELEGRRIAYILYLVPRWMPGDGGTLDLFATDGDGHPSDIVRSLVPKNNAFAFFEVSPVSFHQVSEVLSQDKTRLSINGWFHGPPIPRPKRNPPPPRPLQGPAHLEEDLFYAWINPMYLDMNIQKEIRQKFCSESELELENFLTDEAYERLSEALRSGDLAWQRVGPADRQCYEVLGQDNMPQDVRECQQFLGSEALFLVLSQLTGLKLHAMAPQDSDDDDEEDEESSTEPNPRCHTEAQRWGPGCYTLIRDDCVDNHSALDAFLYTNVSEQWNQQLGGHVTYIAKDEDEELLTVVPQSNCLCLVYRDSQTLRFTKYINSGARDLGADHSHFHNFACTYYE